MQIGFGRIRLILATVAMATAGTAVRAERPMSVDDAGTLTRGDAKLEFGWSKDDETRGFEGAVGYGPIDNVEVEVSFARARDGSVSPSASLRALGAAIKWVPLQAETGLSAGLKYEYGNEHAVGDSSAHVQSLLGLASWAFAGGPLLHLNVGREWAREEGSGSAANTWGIGFDLPFTEALHGTVESYGAENSSPDRAVGLRYELRDGLKFSGAIGRGNDRSFANVGVAWEF